MDGTEKTLRPMFGFRRFDGNERSKKRTFMTCPAEKRRKFNARAGAAREERSR